MLGSIIFAVAKTTVKTQVRMKNSVSLLVMKSCVNVGVSRGLSRLRVSSHCNAPVASILIITRTPNHQANLVAVY